MRQFDSGELPLLQIFMGIYFNDEQNGCEQSLSIIKRLYID